MTMTLVDLMKAADDLQAIYQNVFVDFSPLYDEDDRQMQRALAVLHAWIKQEQEKP